MIGNLSYNGFHECLIGTSSDRTRVVWPLGQFGQRRFLGFCGPNPAVVYNLTARCSCLVSSSDRRQTVEALLAHRLATVATGLFISAARPIGRSVNFYHAQSKKWWRLGRDSIFTDQSPTSWRCLEILQSSPKQECLQDVRPGNGWSARRDGQRARIVPRSLQEIDAGHGL